MTSRTAELFAETLGLLCEKVPAGADRRRRTLSLSKYLPSGRKDHCEQPLADVQVIALCDAVLYSLGLFRCEHCGKTGPLPGDPTCSTPELCEECADGQQ